MSLTQSAIDDIKAMIVSGELRPGNRLPKEPALATRLGLSRGSLREAIRALTLIGILEARQGDGTYVTSLEPAVLMGTLSFVADLHQDTTLLQILEARRTIEAGAAALAAHHATREELDELERLVEAMGACATVEAFVENDMAFHRTLATASRNPVLVALLDSLSGRTTRIRVWRGITQADACARTAAEHRTIYEAVAGRRADLASALIIAHLAGVEAWLERTLGQT